MMTANDILPGQEMPEPVPVDEDHPFLSARGGETDPSTGEKSTGDMQKEFVARLKEKKEWQVPHRTEDAGDVFREVPKKK